MSLDVEDSQLVALVDERFGDDLRGVMTYRRTGEVELQHVREDIDRWHTDEDQDEQIQELLMDTLSAHVQEESFSLGALNCTVRFFDNALILNVIFEQELGVVVSLEPEAGSIDHEFVEQLRTTAVSP